MRDITEALSKLLPEIPATLSYARLGTESKDEREAKSKVIRIEPRMGLLKNSAQLNARFKSVHHPFEMK